MAGRIEAYAFAVAGSPASGATRPPFTSVSQIAIRRQIAPLTVYWARLTTPATLQDQLTAWCAELASQTGLTWSGSYNATTRRVSLTASANWLPTLATTGNPHELFGWLGFSDAPSSWAATHTGDLAPTSVLECTGLRIEPAEDGAVLTTDRYRHGRVLAYRAGNTLLHRVTATWLTDDHHIWTAGYVQSGRIKLTPTGSSGAYSSSNHTGTLDGRVVDVSRATRIGGGHWQAEMLVATARTA